MVADPPSPFVGEWLRILAPELCEPRRALDVAMGRGRHSDSLARAGCRVFGVDLSIDAVRDAVRRQAAQHRVVRAWCADLTGYPLPVERFELVLVTRYLQRDLFRSLQRTLSEGGVLLYETFTTEQRQHGRGPTSPDHLLAPGELRALVNGFDVLFYEEVIAPEAVARVVARKVRGVRR
jgi:SAM-dependent methyltransferase